MMLRFQIVEIEPQLDAQYLQGNYELMEYFLIDVFFIRYSRLQQLQLISDGNFSIFI